VLRRRHHAGEGRRLQQPLQQAQPSRNDWTFSAFSLGRDQMAYVAASLLHGGHVRVGLEDNLMLDRGVLATNAQLVDRAVGIVECLGARVLTPAEVRDRLKLTKRAPAEEAAR
ncbi:MAG: 3-keto-5-aminohexanoate cleavage protein, partial [Pseudomonadota bacterium]